VSALATLDALQEQGYRATLESAELVVRGPGPVPEDLRTELRADTAAMKAAVLLVTPPPWLSKLFELWWNGTETPVQRPNPATGQTEVYMVRVSVNNITALVAAEIGMDPFQWEEIREEVAEALARWEGPA